MAKIEWSSSAESDMKSIYDYIATDSDLYAHKVIERIYRKTFVLKDNPHIGKIVPEFKDVSIRELIEEPYRIIYNVMSEKEIVIVRIYHSSRLLKTL